jgi:cytochrome c biogenesis protein CcmG, thiol:disulfide interchange protein DsbE
MRWRTTMLVIGLLGWLAAGGVGEAKSRLGKLPKDKIARQRLTMLDGRQLSLAELRGQVVVLNFFAVWCGHSRDQLPALSRFAAQSPDAARGPQVIGLAVTDQQTTPERVTQFVKDQRLSYPVGLIDDRAFSGYIDSRDVSVPQTLVYGRDGKLTAHIIGQSAQTDAELTAAVERELAKQ